MNAIDFLAGRGARFLLVAWLISVGLLLAALVPALSAAGFYPDKEGDPLTTRSLEDIRKALAEINTAPDKKLDSVGKERALALQRLHSYRYLAGIPHELELDDELNRFSEGAAKVCAKLGRLDHNPKNPGLPEEEYKIGLKGAQSSNLGVGQPNLARCVDSWMDDSDAGNIDRLGHRRWCINPTMRKVGFGRFATYSAMYTFDMSRKDVPDYDYVSWPPRGLVPGDYFKPTQAWNVSLNPKKYKKPGDTAAAKVYRLDKDDNKLGDPLALNYKNLNTLGFGIPYCLIFRPTKIDVSPGKKYRVEIEGLTNAEDAAATVAFTVEFCKLAPK